MIQQQDEYVQVGITSWGFGCGDNIHPGVYSRVQHQYQWIRAQVCELSVNPPDSFECDAPTLPPTQDVQVTIAVTFDDFPDEITMMVIDETGYGVILVEFPVDSFLDVEPQSTFYHTLTMKENSTYTFIINDSGGDGLCCYKEGSYVVYVGTESDKGEILASGGGNFGEEMVHQFTILAPGSVGQSNNDSSASSPESTAAPSTGTQQNETPAPTLTPTTKPTTPPTTLPSSAPTVAPSGNPTLTPSPTPSPTKAPTNSPTSSPTVSIAPSEVPTMVPQPRDKSQITSIVVGVLIVVIVAALFLATSWYADRHTRRHKVQADTPLMGAEKEEGKFGEDPLRKV